MLLDNHCTPTLYLAFLDSLAPVKLPSINSLKSTNQAMTPSTIVHHTSMKCASVEQTLRTPSTSAVCSVVSAIVIIYVLFSVFCDWMSFHKSIGMVDGDCLHFGITGALVC